MRLQCRVMSVFVWMSLGVVLGGPCFGQDDEGLPEPPTLTDYARSLLGEPCTPLPAGTDRRMAGEAQRFFDNPVHRLVFTEEGNELWLKYLDGRPSKSVLVFRDSDSRFVQSFARHATTAKAQDELLQAVEHAYAQGRGPELEPGRWVWCPIDQLVPANMLMPRLNFDSWWTIPGHTAGGVSKQKGAERSCGPRYPAARNDQDARCVSGYVSLLRSVEEHTGKTITVVVESHLQFEVADVIDFCSGQLGAPVEQLVTRHLSRLEASGLAHAVPFEIHYPAPTITRRFSPETIRKRWPAPTGGVAQPPAGSSAAAVSPATR